MANLLDRASVVLTPTAYNNGEALCIKPDDGSGDFDFSRNSAATRVNAQGLVENVQILSSNLVQNGDFSEEGVQEVSNGSFSQEGAELVTNGSFDTDSDWTKSGNVSISSGKAVFNATSLALLYQDISGTTQGTTYKVTYTISEYISGSIFFGFGNGITSPQGTIRNADGTYTEYITKSDANISGGFRTNAFQGSIDNVSVREVGQDWTIENTWTIGDGVANGNGANGSGEELISNSSNLPLGTYKIVFEIKDYISGSVVPYLSGSTETFSGNGVYTSYKTTTTVAGLKFRGTNFNGSITNISVKEVGMDWDLGSFTSIGNNVANIVNSTGELSLQQNIGVSQKTIKLTYTISNYASGAIRPQYGAVNGLTRSANGTYTEIITGISGSSNLAIFSVTTNTTATITNLSVIAITEDTNLPRISYENFSYQDALGSEEVVNGGFDTNLNNWVAYSNTLISWESGGYALLNSNNNYWCKIKQSNVFEIGKTYKVILTAKSNRTDLNFHNSPITGSFSQADTFETFDQYYTATSTDFLFGYANAGSSTITIDNVSVKEYLGQEVVPNSGCGSWLFEPQSTNLYTQSELFTDSSWSKTQTVIEASSITLPNGLTNGYKLFANTTGSVSHWFEKFPFPTATTGQDYTLSLFVKSAGSDFIQIASSSGFNSKYQNFNISTGIKASGDISDSSITDFGNGWYRISVTETTISTTARYLIVPILSDVGRNAQFAGNADEDGVYIWGAMLEQNSFSTSYIPTNGEPNGVTRNQDVCNNGGSLATINSTEGVLYLEASRLSDLGTCQIGLFGSSSNEQIRIEFNNSSIRAQLYNGSYQVNMTSSQTVTNNNKIA